MEGVNWNINPVRVWKQNRIGIGACVSCIAPSIKTKGQIPLRKNCLQDQNSLYLLLLIMTKLLGIMESYTDVRWKRRELITIAPDTHISKATVKLGLCTDDVVDGSTDDRQTVSEAWEKALKGTGIEPIDVHTPLWLWSRSGFIPLN